MRFQNNSPGTLHYSPATTILNEISVNSRLSGTNPKILTPKRYDEHPRHFYRGVPPPPPNWEKSQKGAWVGKIKEY